jgi:hypothetical protein
MPAFSLNGLKKITNSLRMIGVREEVRTENLQNRSIECNC